MKTYDTSGFTEAYGCKTQLQDFHFSLNIC